jgi:murein DD-endopeptidase MepM/ murein hydrolase activator NlpD
MGAFSTDSAHLDHIHIAFDDPIGLDFAGPDELDVGKHHHSHHVAAVNEPGPRVSAVFAAPDSAGAAAGQPVDASRSSNQGGSVADASMNGLHPSGATDGPVPPIAPEDMANTNLEGLLHGSEFGVPSPEGALGPGGRVHAGYDLFAIGGSPVRAPCAGTIVEVRPSRGSSGQLFGGNVKVQADDGRVWVFRHVDPASISKGMRIEAGQQIATVTPWKDGPPHAHIELWKRLDGGYVITNMEDPLDELKRAYSRR